MLVLAQRSVALNQSYLLSSFSQCRGIAQGPLILRISRFLPEPCKIAREYDLEANREEITWTSSPILAGCQGDLILYRETIGILTDPDNT